MDCPSDNVCRNLIRIWIAKAEAGEFDNEVAAVEVLVRYKARIASLERLFRQQALELSFVKRGCFANLADKRAYIRDRRSSCVSVKRVCELMGVARSSYYAAPATANAGAALVTEIRATTDAWECYVKGFLGLGANPVAIPISNLNFMRDEGGTVHATTTMTKDASKDLPEHKD